MLQFLNQICDKCEYKQKLKCFAFFARQIYGNGDFVLAHNIILMQNFYVIMPSKVFNGNYSCPL